MSAISRDALRHLHAAMEAHLEAIISRRSATDAAVDDAFDAVVEAFERYEDVLDTEFGESLPFVLDDEIADALDDDDVDDDIDDDDLENLDPHGSVEDDDLDDLDEFDLR